MRRAPLILALLVSACVTQRASFSRPSLVEELADLGREAAQPTPTLQEIEALRTPAGPPFTPPDGEPRALNRARVAAALGDLASARAEWSLAILERDAGDAWFHRCITERLASEPGAAQACAEAIRADVDDNKRAAAGLLLAELAEEDAQLRPLVASRARALARVCEREDADPHACVDARAVLARAWRRFAEESKDEAAARAALALEGVRTDLAADGRPVRRWDGGAAGEPGQRTRLSARLEARGRVAVSARGARVLAIVVDEVAGSLREGQAQASAQFTLRPGPHQVVVEVEFDVPGFAHLAVAPAQANARVGAASLVGARVAGVSRTWPAPALESGASDLAALDDALATQLVVEAGLRGGPGAAAAHRDALLRSSGFAPAVLVQSALGVLADARLPPAVRQADARRLLQRVRDHWPTHADAAWLDVVSTTEMSRSAALARARAFTRAHPSERRGWRRRARLALRAGLLDEARDAATTLTAPHTYDDLDVLEAVASRSGDLAGAARLERELLNRAAAIDDLGAARRALAAGDRSPLTHIAALRGQRTALEWDALAHGEPETYRDALREAVAERPEDLELWRRYAAHEPSALDDALSRFPLDAELHALAEELDREVPWSDALARGEMLMATPPALPPEFDGAPLVFELDERERVVTQAGASLIIEHLVARLRSEEAVAAFGELSLPVERRLIKLRAVGPDGVSRRGERPPGIPDLALPALTIGDRVELLTVAYETVDLRGPFVELRALRDATPALARSWTLRGPKSIFDEAEWLGEPVLESGEPWQSARFAIAPAAPVTREPWTPTDAAAASVVGVARGAAPRSLALAIAADLDLAAAPHPWLTSAARDIAGEGSARARVARLFRFVARRIEPASSPVDAVEVLAAGRGARTPLLLALCRALQLPVSAVQLGAPLDRGAIPGPDRWPVSALVLDGAFSTVPLVVDGGYALMGGLPPQMASWDALRLEGDPGAVRPIDSAWISSRPVTARVALELEATSVGGGWTGFLALTLPPWSSAPMRTALAAADPEQRRAAFERALGESFPGCTVIDVSIEGADAGGAPLGIGVVMRAPAAVSEGRLDMPGIFARGVASSIGVAVGLDDYQLASGRENDVLIGGLNEQLEVAVRAPPGAAFTRLPPSGRWRAGPIELSQRAVVTDGALQWSRGLRFDPTRVPVAEWDEIAARVGELAERSRRGFELLTASSPGGVASGKVDRR